MRFLHSADWHLGRLLHARSLIEDQAHILRQILEHARALAPDALLLAGDVYDRAVPSPEAVALLDDFLGALVLGLRIPVVMIAGNHDSGERLGFGARMLAASGLHIGGKVSAAVQSVRFEDRHGAVLVHPLPYAEPAEVRAAFGAAQPLGHAAAMRLQLDAIRVALPAGARSVVVAHAFVAGGTESESERPLSVGGSGAVDAELFAGFDYVALGHLHRPQSFDGGHLRYAGSPLKYSLSEAGQDKSLTLVELGDRPGQPVRVETLPLTPLRDLHLLTGTLEQVCRPCPGVAPGDFVIARVSDRGALLDPMTRLRNAWPNALALQRDVLLEGGEAAARGSRRAETSPAALFTGFFAEVTGEPLTDGQRQMAAGIIDGVLRADGAGGATGQSVPEPP